MKVTFDLRDGLVLKVETEPGDFPLFKDRDNLGKIKENQDDQNIGDANK